jgi:hypothetical protein
MIEKVSLTQRNRVSAKGRRVTPVTVEERNYPSAAAVARKLGNVSAKTVCRDLKHLGMKQWATGVGPQLKPEDKRVRVRLARRMLRMNKSEFDRMMFSDEKIFDLQTKRFVKLWGTRPPTGVSGSHVQGGPHVFVLGFMSRTAKRLVFIDEGTMTADVYERQLMAYSRVIKRHIFQQDNASPHATVVRRGFFEKQKIRRVHWPPYSPDLNVIETLWAILADKVKKRGPLGGRELKDFIREAWSSVTNAQMRGLVGEFRDRLRVCVEQGGGLVTRTLLKAFRARAGKKKICRRRTAKG